MSEPFDLDAVLAESTDVEPFRFVFDGNTYEIPGGDVDVRILALWEKRRLDLVLQLLVGDEQWEQMRSTDKMIGGRAIEAVFEAFVEHAQGVKAGKSSRSGGSSKSTAERSKPTSNASTKSD